jgi:uncharacterized membrane protein
VNPVYLHLILNHIPLLGTLFAAVLMALGVARQSDELTRVALGFAVAMSLFTIPTYLTGDPAREVAETLPGVSEFLMDDHEEAALLSLVGLELCGALALGGLVVFRQAEEMPKWLVTSVLVGLVISFGLTASTAYLGGQIRHTEVHSDY